MILVTKFNKLYEILIGSDPDSLRARLIKGATGTMMLRASSILLGLISSVLLARFTGAHGYGIYTFALSWINLLMVFATFGTQNLIIRETSIYKENKNWANLHGLIRWSNILSGSFSLLIATILATTSYWLYLTFDSDKVLGLIVASLLIPILTLSTIRQATLQGLHYVVSGQIPEFIVRPTALIILFIISYLLLGDKFTGLIAITNNFLAAIVTFIVGVYLLHKFLPKGVRKTTPVYLGKTWLYIALPFFVISGLQAANSHIAILVLGFYVDAAEIGVFSVALRIAGLLSFFLLSANAILAPNIASLYNKNEHEQLQKMVTKSARIILLLSFPVTLILIIFGNFILSIFGNEFVAGYKILIILSIGQLFNAAMGSVGLLLTMTRHEHDMLWGVLIGFVINATLNMFLIPLYGAIGAAISTTIYTLLWNVIIAILVFKRIDIIPSIIGRKK